MQHSSQLIILNCTKTGDKSLIAHTLTPLWGRRNFIVSANKCRAAALLQPMNILNAEICENPKSDLWRIKSFSPAYPLGGIRNSIYKNTITLFLGEVLYRSLTEGNYEDKPMFDLCVKSILTLDALRSDFSNFHILFLLDFATALGFRPDCESIIPFAGGQTDNLNRILTSDRSEAMLIPLSGEDRNAIATALVDYLGHHLENNLNIRSLKVLREIYR